MSISSAMFAGVSGLTTIGSSLAVIGDNIANINTIGFKSSRSTFETMLAENITGASGTSQVGRGVAMSAVDEVFTQGSFETTGEPTDMAIGGDGFFMVRSSETGMYYTRAGHFKFNEDGYLVNPADMRVQGWILEPESSDPRGAITDIQINVTSSSPNPTEEVDLAVNLDSRLDVVDTAPTAESEDATQSGFIFDDTDNDTFIITDGGGVDTIDLVTGVAGSPLEAGKVYTGQQVASALETALGTSAALTNTYTVTYVAKDNEFTITDTSAVGSNYTIELAGLANEVFGFPATSDTTAAAGGSLTGAESAYNVTDLNNTFSITVNGNPNYLNPISVVLDNGVYSIVELRKHLEDKINAQLLAVGESGTVDVRYNEADDVWQISSSGRDEDSSIQVHLVANNFLEIIGITDYTEQTTSDGLSLPGFTESKDANSSRFILGSSTVIVYREAGATATADISNFAGDATLPAYSATLFYTGEQVAYMLDWALEDVSANTYTVGYDPTTDRFTITNNGAATVDILWTDALTTAEGILGYSETDNLAVGGSGNSDNAVGYNIITGTNDTLTIIVNGNPLNGGVPINVTVDAGVYTGQTLARELEDKINDALDTAGEEETVDVTYNDATNRFRIASSILGGESTLRVNPGGISDPATTPTLVGGTLWMDDSTENVGQGFSVENPNDTSDYATSLVHYDSLGNQHTVTYYFRKAIEGDTATTWEWFAYVTGADTASGDGEVQARGTMTFNNQGILTNESAVTWLTERIIALPGGGSTIAPGIGFDFGGGAEPQQEVDIDFGLEVGTNLSTQFSSPSATIFQTQDGYGSGFLQDISVSPDGVVSGHYSNGQVLYLARLALANFVNPWGLSREGGNLWGETRESGQPLTGTPGSAGMGRLAPNSLEQSNVDLSREFVDMIIQQRGFQANSRVITTADAMLGELINLKR